MLFVSFASSLVSAQVNLCQKQVEYAQCTTNAHQSLSQCSSNVKNTPTAEYYACICDAQIALAQCYDICFDDPNLQLQRVVQQSDTNASCQTAKNIKESEQAQEPMQSTLASVNDELKGTITTELRESTETTLILNDVETDRANAITSASDIVMPTNNNENTILFGAGNDSSTFAFTLFMIVSLLV